MFYSHEVLTSRKYGVATVWLVATLGSKSSLKKVSRKAILDVDVQKACETIVTPDAPMALRLQSNLLYGVTRVYSQQWGYMLSDAETAKSNMRVLLKAMHASTLDAEGENSGRADQLVLRDDPNFLPDLDLMPLDLDMMEVHLAQDSQRSTLSPKNSQRTSAASHSQIDIGDLIIPPSASSFMGGSAGGFGGFGGRGDSSAGLRTRVGGLDDDLGLGINEDGTLRMADEEERQPAASFLRRENIGGEGVNSRAGSRRETAGRDQNAFVMPGQDDFLPPQDDGYQPVLDAQLSPTRRNESAQQPQEETSEESAEAPLRRRARPALKIIPLDNRMELRNGDLARWDANYVANMHDLILQKNVHKATAIAKKNAEYWILGREHTGPLSIFSGAKLLEALTGVNLRAVAGHKRPRDDVGETADDRQVRPRSEPQSDEIGRGLMDDGYMPVFGDDTIEQGREAPTPLEDRPGSSIMPWNQSAGSRRPTELFGAGGGGFPTSSGGFGGSDQQRGLFSRRPSRLTSASPLLGRGTADAAAMDIDDFQLPDMGDNMDLTSAAADFEAFGPAAQVDTQTAEQSQWIWAALDGESSHFLDYVQAGIVEMDEARGRLEPGEEEDDELKSSVDFDVLLPPTSHSRIVAAQALLHVLALGMKNLINVRQPEAFGAITIRVGPSL